MNGGGGGWSSGRAGAQAPATTPATTVAAGPRVFSRAAVEARAAFCPVGDVPERLHVVGLDVDVVEVEGVLPHVELQDRDGAERRVALLVEELLDDQALADRVPGEHGPAGALQAVRRGGEVRRRTCRTSRRTSSIAAASSPIGLVAAVRGQVGPEDRVVDVTAEVEGEVLLELVARCRSRPTSRASASFSRAVFAPAT